ncbi:MAG: hypothetical protein AAGA46_16000 [Cyanobacteria bacterium P01_F01_bin.13]
MIISDLNYLESAKETVVGGSRRRRGGDINLDAKVRKDVKVEVDVYERYDKIIFADAYVVNNSAFAQAFADADGYNSFSETLTFTDVNTYESNSFSQSVSAVQ